MSESPPAEKPSAGRVAGMWAKEIAIVVIGALVASTLLRLFIAQMFVIPSGSMENTLLIRDRVMVQKVAGWSRGDRVFHQKFGYGQVRAVEGNKLVVSFDKAGEKKVIDTFVEKA